MVSSTSKLPLKSTTINQQRRPVSADSKFFRSCCRKNNHNRTHQNNNDNTGVNNDIRSNAVAIANPCCCCNEQYHQCENVKKVSVTITYSYTSIHKWIHQLIFV